MGTHNGKPTHPTTVRVWDIVVRAFHWATAVLFFAAYFIDRPRDLHEGLGYALAAILVVRIIWGFVGTKHARFMDFVPSPKGFWIYTCAMVRGRERRYIGHNPAGGAMVIALLLCLCGIILTGWVMGLDAYWGKEWVEDLHEGLVSFMLLLVALHVVGVIYESLRHGENLVRAMISGEKRMD